jgi:hypothetical protein
LNAKKFPIIALLEIIVTLVAMTRQEASILPIELEELVIYQFQF